MMATPGEPLMTLPDTALRRAERKREGAARAWLPAWMERLRADEVDAILELFPTCAVCRRPVERLAWTCDPATPEAMTFTTWCHGAEESVTVPKAKALRGEMPAGLVFAGAGAVAR